ncbi:MAG TPA: DHH family phosphoesterase [Candidatus Saccharimonadales bacterium]|jgi:phosphoesterase RecJ-like protein|nr:DHH family phosphoesterase [Candidatus Saccharimonadales bacterium]
MDVDYFKDVEAIQEIVNNATKIVIVQADVPDGDSLGSALALEQILGDLGKQPFLNCGVVIPKYLRYISGWDRVSQDLPAEFDASIIVDTATDNLLDSLERSGQRKWLASKPCIVIDHHNVTPSIPYATTIFNRNAVATGEVIFQIAKHQNWPLNQQANESLLMAIMSDSLGLTSEATTAQSIRIVAEIVESGVSIAGLENKRRQLMRKKPETLTYKGKLLQRVEYYANNRIAMVTIPWEEIREHSYDYNPSMLVLDDMRMVDDVDVAIAFKFYKDGKITAKIRCNYEKGIALKLAEQFGGGGHRYASGYKITDGRTLENIKNETITKAAELLDNLDNDSS